MSCVTHTQTHLHQRTLAWDHLSVSNRSQQFEINFLVTFSSAFCRDIWRSCICLPISTGTSVYRLCTLSVMHLSLVFWEDNSFVSSCQCGKDKKYRNQRLGVWVRHLILYSLYSTAPLIFYKWDQLDRIVPKKQFKFCNLQLDCYIACISHYNVNNFKSNTHKKVIFHHLWIMTIIKLDMLNT